MTGGAGAVEPLPVCTALLCLAAALWCGAGPGRRSRRGTLVFADWGLSPSSARASAQRTFGTRDRVWVARLLAALGGDDAWRRWSHRLLEVTRRWDLGGELLCLPAGAVLALLTGSPLPLAVAVLAVLLGRRWRRAKAERRVRARRRAAVIEVCAAVAGELRAGRQPGEALGGVEVAEFSAEWRAVTVAARFGGDVPSALRRVALLPGAEGMAGAAACWRVAVSGGAGLAAGLDRVAVALRAERDQHEDLQAQLAGVTATAVMLALLPLFGLVLGSALGAEPLRVLLHTPAGRSCLVLGALLEWAGLAWTVRIIRRAAGPTPSARKAGPIGLMR